MNKFFFTYTLCWKSFQGAVLLTASDLIRWTSHCFSWALFYCDLRKPTIFKFQFEETRNFQVSINYATWNRRYFLKKASTLSGIMMIFLHFTIFIRRYATCFFFSMLVVRQMVPCKIYINTMYRTFLFSVITTLNLCFWCTVSVDLIE